MKTLTCDLVALTHGTQGPTEAYLRQFLCNDYDYESAVIAVRTDLYQRAKTVPWRLARRLACLVGVICTEFSGHEREYLLDLVITAFESPGKEPQDSPTPRRDP
jgi:hypothetical protein